MGHILWKAIRRLQDAVEYNEGTKPTTLRLKEFARGREVALGESEREYGLLAVGLRLTGIVGRHGREERPIYGARTASNTCRIHNPKMVAKTPQVAGVSTEDCAPSLGPHSDE